jgi:hypothetical protein
MSAGTFLVLPSTEILRVVFEGKLDDKYLQSNCLLLGIAKP